MGANEINSDVKRPWLEQRKIVEEILMHQVQPNNKDDFDKILIIFKKMAGSTQTCKESKMVTVCKKPIIFDIREQAWS